MVKRSVEKLAHDWAVAIAARSFVPMGLRELELLLHGLAGQLLASYKDGSASAAAAEVGAAMVEAHLTNPAVLEATLTVLDRHLPAGRRLAAARRGVAGGYARALRAVTLAEQERLTEAIVGAQAHAEWMARQSEDRFRAVFTQAAVGIGISDEHGRIVQVNPALANMLGYRPEEMQGLSVADLAHPSDPPRMWELYEQMARGEVEHLRMDKAYYRKDGAVVWTDMTVTQLRDAAGRPQFNIVILADVTERHHLQERLRHQATHDPLTRLPNRALFTDRLAEVIADAANFDRIGVCYLDLDGFKRINDTLGHDIGDRLLAMVATRLGECATERGYLAARMGGDEFVILVEHSTGPDQLAELAEAALGTLQEPVAVGRHRLRVSASIGVVERPAASADPAEILKAADVTLYRAKAAGRGRWALYDPDEVAEEVARYELSAELPDALDRGEFVLVYQPIVALPEEKLIGLEALVRWNHPRLGLLAPDRFIALAEETGVIVPLGRYVLWQACREAATWPARFPAGEVFVSVNLAAAQTHEASLVGDVRQVLSETGLPASRLQLELTESALMTTSGEPLRALHSLADHGVRMAIDDFGTGYSSLAYLRSLPVHTLKLPREFIEGLAAPAAPESTAPEKAAPESAAVPSAVGESPAGESVARDVDERIVDALIRLAHAIDLTVTAEGVETKFQADRLSALGCDSAQGWYIAAPYTPEQLSEHFAR